MKNLFFILLSICLVSQSKAEYTKFHIKILFEITTGEKITAYQFIHPEMDKDSVQNAEYVTWFWNQTLRLGTDSITIYKSRLKYQFTNYNQPMVMYKLFDEIKLPLGMVKSIKVLENFVFGYDCWIQNAITLADTNWMKKPAIDKLSIEGYLCNFDIYVHKKSPAINKLNKVLQEKKRLHKLKDETDDDISLDRALEDIISQYNKQKLQIVIVECCSC